MSVPCFYGWQISSDVLFLDCFFEMLLLRDVRQYGKTSAVRHFADQFENYVEINFEENERYETKAPTGRLKPRGSFSYASFLRVRNICQAMVSKA